MLFVMKHQFRGEREVKNGLHNEAERVKTGSRESDPATDTPFEEVDPAEFFDPEEFGIRRPDSRSFPA